MIRYASLMVAFIGATAIWGAIPTVEGFWLGGLWAGAVGFVGSRIATAVSGSGADWEDYE